MAMSTQVVGFGSENNDETWLKKKALYEECVAKGSDIPDEILDYFGGSIPDPLGKEIWLKRTECVTEWDDGDYRTGFTVDLSKLPEGTTHIRFYNSW